MPIPVKCPECEANFRVDEEQAGKSVKCAECGGTIRVPGGAASAVSASPAAPPPASPAPRSRPAADRDEEAAPRRSRPGRDDDPPRPRKRSGGGVGMTLAIIGGVLLVFFLVCAGVTGVVGYMIYTGVNRGVAHAKQKIAEAEAEIKKGGAIGFAGGALNAPATTVVFGADGGFRHDGVLVATDARYNNTKLCKAYQVQLEAGRRYQIDLIAPTFDAYLLVHNPQNQLIAQDDDGGGALNSRIVLIAPQTGNYRIYATSLGGGSTGPFTLMVRRL